MKKISKFLFILVSFVLILSSVSAASKTSSDDSTMLFIAIGMELFCSIHMSVFVLMPLAKFISSKNWGKMFGILFGIRAVILVIGDFILPMGMAVLDFISIFLGAFILMPIINGAKIAHKNQYIELDDFPDISDYEAASLQTGSIDEFKNLMISKVIDIEHAYSDFDYNRLKELCTVKQYIKFSNEMKALQKKGHKSIIADFDVKDSKVYSVNPSKNEILASIVFTADVQDFVVDSTGKLKSGENKKVTKVYMVDFVKDATGEEIIHNCPNCGAGLEDANSSVCKYCAGVIERKNKDWVLASFNKVNAKK